MGEQHGFRPKRSALTCHLVFTKYFFDAFQDESQVDVIYTDFNKAFNTVYHNALVSVLKASGLGEPLVFWVQFYHSDKYQ